MSTPRPTAAAPAPAPKLKDTRVQSVTRATTLLMLVATKRTDGSGKALARAAGLAVPTAHHLLATLIAEGYLAQDERARYLLGPTIAVLADAFQRDLAPPSYLLAPLHRVASMTGETTYLATWRRGQILVGKVIEGHRPVRVSVSLGGYHDAHARASGKVLLAHLDADERDAYVAAHPLRKRTKSTITSRRRLTGALEETRQRGYALDEEELEEGVCGISVPVLEDSVIVAALSLLIPAQRYHERKDELIDAVLQAIGRQQFEL